MSHTIPVLQKKIKNQREKIHTSSWEEDSEVKLCGICKLKFSLTRRKHQCRKCLKVFCSTCSANKLVVDGILKRSCTLCYDLFLQHPSTHVQESPSKVSTSAFSLSSPPSWIEVRILSLYDISFLCAII